jgi:hypothetical protein
VLRRSLTLIVILLCVGAYAQDATRKSSVTFKNGVAPIIKRNCLPCHAEDNFNPSELALDTYESLMAGGKHGPPVIPGNAEASTLYKKLSADPPFGDRMPYDPKRKKGEEPKKTLTPEELRIIAEWINGGAKND